MKTLRFFLSLFLFIAGLYACSNDFVDIDDINPNDTQSIQKALAGNWELVEQAGRDCTNITELWEFKTDNSCVFTLDVGVEATNRQDNLSYSIIDGWTKEDGVLSGYVLVQYPEYDDEFHLWLTKDKMKMIAKGFEGPLTSPPFYDPLQIFNRIK